jgi:hypothetical protein
MMAATAEGKMKNNNPQSRLTTASPLVVGGTAGVCGEYEADAGVASAGGNFTPHCGQNPALLSGTGFPQETQVRTMAPLRSQRFSCTVPQLSKKSTTKEAWT